MGRGPACIVATTIVAIGMLLVSTVPAHAGTLTLWPGDFSDASADAPELLHKPGMIISNQNFNGMFTAPVQLPVGTTITALRSSQNQPNLGCRPTVSLTRKKFAGFEEMLLYAQPMAAATGAWESVPIELPSPAVVQGGYIYSVQVSLPGCDSLQFGGIRVIYQ